MLVISRLWIITIPNLAWQMHISVFKFVSVAKLMQRWILPTLLNPNSLKKTTTTTGDWQAKHILSKHTSTDIICEAAGVDIRFWKALARGGGEWGAQTWHNFNLTYCLSSCPVINTIYTIYCAIINVKIQKYIFWFSLQKYFTNKFCLTQGQVTFRI